MPQCDDLKDQEIDQAVRKTAKESNKIKDGGMPQCGGPQKSRNRSSSEKVRKRSDKPKNGGYAPMWRPMSNSMGMHRRSDMYSDEMDDAKIHELDDSIQKSH